MIEQNVVEGYDAVDVELLQSQVEELAREQELFGEASYLVQVGAEDMVSGEPQLSLVGNWGYEFFILFVALLYLVWGSRRLSIKMSGFFRGESHTLDGSGGARVGENINASNGIVGGGGSGAKIVSDALAWSLVLSGLILLLSKGAELAKSSAGVPYLGDELRYVGSMIEGAGLGAWMAIVAALFCAMTLWFVVVMWCADWLARSKWLYGAAVELRSTVAVWCSVAMLPLLLLGALDYGASLLFYLSVAIVAVGAAYYVGRSFLLFAQQKVSLLHWFLYLCAVEIVPLTLVWKMIDNNL
ncbi:MAG: DUF4271 domain-containing protein [Rikenellaceae bacterium]